MICRRPTSLEPLHGWLQGPCRVVHLDSRLCSFENIVHILVAWHFLGLLTFP